MKWKADTEVVFVFVGDMISTNPDQDYVSLPVETIMNALVHLKKSAPNSSDIVWVLSDNDMYHATNERLDYFVDDHEEAKHFNADGTFSDFHVGWMRKCIKDMEATPIFQSDTIVFTAGLSRSFLDRYDPELKGAELIMAIRGDYKEAIANMEHPQAGGQILFIFGTRLSFIATVGCRMHV